ncbi:MAG: phage holin family protein [Actinomycetota bacterium]|nr:phage holin family protein [Actinomycetota bacterium]
MSHSVEPVQTDTPRPLGELISEITEDLSTLVHQEIELAKAEAKESATRAGKGVGMFGGAGLAGHFVLLFLSIALWWGLGDATGYAWSALIVAAIWAVIAVVLVTVGRKEFRSIRGMQRTAETVQKIPNAVKGHEQENRQ